MSSSNNDMINRCMNEIYEIKNSSSPAFVKANLMRPLIASVMVLICESAGLSISKIVEKSVYDNKDRIIESLEKDGIKLPSDFFEKIKISSYSKSIGIHYESEPMFIYLNIYNTWSTYAIGEYEYCNNEKYDSKDTITDLKNLHTIFEEDFVLLENLSWKNINDTNVLLEKIEKMLPYIEKN